MVTETGRMQWGRTQPDRRDLPLAVSTLKKLLGPEQTPGWSRCWAALGLPAGPEVGWQGSQTVKKPQGEAAGWGLAQWAHPQEL